MYVLWVTLQVQPEHRQEFLAAITANAAASVRDEPGCLAFDVIELDGTANRFAFYETYTDREAFAVGHQQAPHFLRWREVAARVLVPGSQVNTFGHVVAGAASESAATTAAAAVTVAGGVA